MQLYQLMPLPSPLFIYWLTGALSIAGSCRHRCWATDVVVAQIALFSCKIMGTSWGLRLAWPGCLFVEDVLMPWRNESQAEMLYLHSICPCFYWQWHSIPVKLLSGRGNHLKRALGGQQPEEGYLRQGWWQGGILCLKLFCCHIV